MTDQQELAISHATKALISLTEETPCFDFAESYLIDALNAVRVCRTNNVMRTTMTRDTALFLLRNATSAQEWNAAVCQIQQAFVCFPEWLKGETPNFGGFAIVKKRKDRS